MQTDHHAVLLVKWQTLPKKHHELAQSLVKQHLSGKTLTDKQLYWVKRFSNMLTGEPRAPKPEAVEFEVGSYAAVMDLFDKAKAEYPKIKLLTQGDGQPVALAPITKGAHKGKLNITDGGPYQNNKWFGRIDKNGTWTVGPDVTDELLEPLAEVIHDFGEHPALAIKSFGLFTGKCSLCMLPLTDPKSIAAGIGPVCAKNYGLPWGD